MSEKIIIGGNKNPQDSQTENQSGQIKFELDEIRSMVYSLRENGVPDEKITQTLKATYGISDSDVKQAFDSLQKKQSFSSPEIKVKEEAAAPYISTPKINKQVDDDIFEMLSEEVELPSRGVFYNGQSKIKIKHLTASEDDILYDYELIKSNQYLNALLEATVIDKSLRPNELLTGDRNYLLIFLRRTGLGDIYKPGFMACSSCGGTHNPEIDLSKLSPKVIEHLPDNNGEYSLKMPNLKVDIKFRFLKGSDEELIMKYSNMNTNTFGKFKVSKIFAQKYILHIMEVNGKRDKTYIKSYVEAMPMNDSAFFRKYLAELEPGINLDFNFKCPHCGHEEIKKAPITSKLFYPELDI